MNSDDYFEYEGRLYPNPTKTRDETLSFVDSLRNTVSRDNQAIATQTERLGTDVSSNLGGLTGSESYFTQRYQTTPIEYQVNTLKATAQADALNKLMTNYKNQAANRYQQAYRNAARSAGGSSYSYLDGDGSDLESVLQLNVNADRANEQRPVSTTDWSGQAGRINQEPSGKEYTLIYKTPYKEPVKVYLNNLTGGDDISSVTAKLGQGYNTQVKTLNGVKYIWMDTGQLAPSWYRVGASSAPLGDS